jgi:hypothetical protein
MHLGLQSPAMSPEGNYEAHGGIRGRLPSNGGYASGKGLGTYLLVLSDP